MFLQGLIKDKDLSCVACFLSPSALNFNLWFKTFKKTVVYAEKEAEADLCPKLTSSS